MIAATLSCLILVAAIWGLSRPLIRRLPLDAAEGLLAALMLSLLAAYGIAWAIFTGGAAVGLYRLIPLLGVVGLAFDWRGLRRLWADPAARELILSQALVTAWCVAWLSFIRIHSGGAWTGDATEHWERAALFLRKPLPPGLILGTYEVSARPPLGNVLTAVLLELLGYDYARYQLAMAVLCSLSFLPLAMLARRFGGTRAIAVAAVAAMLNPLFIQNCTYPWTKLQCAFFVLGGLYFFLRLRDGDIASRTPGVLCGLSLGAALITHYSAGPYVVVLAAAWVILGFRRRWRNGLVRTTAWAALGGAAVLASWLVWSVATYGADRTFLSNTTVSMARTAQLGPVATYFLNIRDTLIPPQVRGFSGRLFRQASLWGNLRDQFFLVYQVNAVLALGCAGWIVAGREACRAGKADLAAARFWGGLVLGVFLLAFTTYGDREHYGLAHIWFHSLVLLGLAFLAARWSALEPPWRRLLVFGWVLDFILGIELQFADQDLALDRWLTPARRLNDVIASYSAVVQENFREKVLGGQPYFADLLKVPEGMVVAFLLALLVLASWRAARARRFTASPSA